MNVINYLVLITTLNAGLMPKAIAQNLSQIEPPNTYQSMSKETYEQHYQTFNAEFQTAMHQCASINNAIVANKPKQIAIIKNDKVIINNKAQCKSHAFANRDIKKADLQARYKPTIQNRYRANMIKAELNYKLTSEQCVTLRFDQEISCVKAAKNHRSAEAANARAQRNIEMNQAILKSKIYKLEQFNESHNPFVSTDLKRPIKYMT